MDIKAIVFSCVGFVISMSSFSSAIISESKTYQDAIIDVALHQSINTSKSLKTMDSPSARVVVFTNYTGYSLNDDKFGASVWVTLDPEIKELCSQYVKENQPTHEQLTEWLAKLLGLPIIRASSRQFVLIDVPTIQAYYGDNPNNIGIFRPCTDPRIAKHIDDSVTCPAYMNMDDKNIASDFKTWFINNSIYSHSLSNGAPWTEYGYTYNWNEDATDSFGVSEFVILKNTPMKIVPNPNNQESAYLSAEEYCQL